MKTTMKTYFTLFAAVLLAQASLADGLAVRDSIGLERRNDQIYVLYRVDPGQTVYSICQKYNVTTEDLKRHNENLNLDQIRIGQVIRIPISMNSNFGQTVTTRPGQQAQTYEQTQVQPTKKRVGHMVRSGESLYAISGHYKMDINHLKRINGLTSDKLSIGQTLWVEMDVQPSAINANNQVIGPAIQERTTVVQQQPQQPGSDVPWWALKEAVDTPNTLDVLHTAEPGETFLSIARRFNTTTAQLQAWNPNVSDPVPSGRTLVVGKTPVEQPKKAEQSANNGGGNTQLPGIGGSGKMEIPSSRKVVGFGEMIYGNTLTGSEKHMAMHNTAHIGTYIKVTNPNTGKSTYAKVIARIPASELNKEVVIKLSKETCDFLGISEQKFQVLLEYND